MARTHFSTCSLIESDEEWMWTETICYGCSGKILKVNCYICIYMAYICLYHKWIFAQMKISVELYIYLFSGHKINSNLFYFFFRSTFLIIIMRPTNKIATIRLKVNFNGFRFTGRQTNWRSNRIFWGEKIQLT